MLELLAQIYEFLLSQASGLFYYVIYIGVLIPTAITVRIIWLSELSTERRVAFSYVLVFFCLPALLMVFLPGPSTYLREFTVVTAQTPEYLKHLYLFTKASPFNLALGVNAAFWGYLWVLKPRMVLDLIDRHFILSLAGITLGPLFYLMTIPAWGNYWTLVTLVFGLVVVLWADLRTVFFMRLYRWLVSEEQVLIKLYRRFTGGGG